MVRCTAVKQDRWLLMDMARQLFDRWTELDRYLLVKYIDGNLKSETEPGKFLDNGNGRDIPDKIQFPGYNEKWKRAVVADHGEVLKVFNKHIQKI